MSEEPTPPYSRRRSEEITRDRLTDFRLKQLEAAVQTCSETSGKVLVALNEMNSRLAVGAERFVNVDKRIESLEGDRRWTVMAVLSALGSLVWHLLTSLMGGGSKLLLIASLALLMAGCGKERAQNASDTRAGVVAAMRAAADAGADDAVAILTGVDKRLPAVADVNSADWPPPKMTPEAIRTDPKAYSDSAPPEPARGWLWAGAGAAGLALLAGFRALAPLVPGIGPLWKFGADALWAVVQHADAKRADQVQANAAQALSKARPILAALPTVAPEAWASLPNSIQDVIRNLTKEPT